MFSLCITMCDLVDAAFGDGVQPALRCSKIWLTLLRFRSCRLSPIFFITFLFALKLGLNCG